MNVRWYSVTEYHEPCQSVLAEYDPEHIFVDVRERASGDWVEELSAKQMSFATQASANASRTHSSEAAWTKSMGSLFFEEACPVLAQATFRETCFCKKHGQECPCRPCLESGDIWVELSGNTCTPWSSSGSQRGFLDAHALTGLIWATSLANASTPPHLIINENTPRYPGEQIWAALCPDWAQYSASLSPANFGLPVSRPRKYLGVSRLPHTAAAAAAPLDLLQLMDCDIDASLFFEVPEHVTEAFIRSMAEGRNLAAPAGISAKDLLSFAVRQRLGQYKESWEAYRQAAGPASSSDLGLVDVSQNFAYAGPRDWGTRNHMPTLKGFGVNNLIERSIEHDTPATQSKLVSQIFLVTSFLCLVGVLFSLTLQGNTSIYSLAKKQLLPPLAHFAIHGPQPLCNMRHHISCISPAHFLC